MRTLVELPEETTDRWQVVNDGVMGGLSRSEISFDESGATFEGDVSLRNDGGFASVRTLLPETDLSRWDGIALRVEGGGRTFQLRILTDDAGDGVAYRARFETPVEGARQVRIPFRTLEPTWRGRVVPDHGPLDPAQIRQIGFLIADGQAGPFRLRVEWIRAYRGDARETVER
jgi:monofunctional biosynthetic peptidoglycan transglycosylase